jgi:hypothetical protein
METPVSEVAVALVREVEAFGPGPCLDGVFRALHGHCVTKLSPDYRAREGRLTSSLTGK